jgi:Ser/Thr protein kinase RdoA (MazF antagonist)
MVKSPAFLVDAQNCPTLIDALQGGYRYVSPDSEELAQVHPFEDVADALRYAVWDLATLLMDSSDWARELRKNKHQQWLALEKLRQYNQRRGAWYG